MMFFALLTGFNKILCESTCWDDFQLTDFKTKFVEIMTIMASSIEKEMQNYFTQLNEAQKKSVVQLLRTLLQNSKKKSGRITVEQYNKEIEEAIQQIKKNEVRTHEEVVKISKNW